MTEEQLVRLRASSSEHGNRVAAAFDITGLMQADCVRQTSFTRQYVSDTARCRFPSISLDNARKYAEYFGCSIEDLFPAPDDPSVQPVLPFVRKAAAR